MICHFQLYFHDPSSNPLSPHICVVFLLQSKPLQAVWIQSITEKHSKHPRLPGWLITWCKRGSHVRKSQQSQLYSVVAPSVLPLRWILRKKTEAHHVVIILCSVSLSFPRPHFSCYPALNGTADELGIEFMGKTTFHWLCRVLNLSVCLTSVKYCIQNTHNQHNKAAHLGKLMWASRHGNTVVVN